MKSIAIKIFHNVGQGYQEKETLLFRGEPFPAKLALPKEAPFGGYVYSLSTDGNRGYEFTPNGGESFIRFGPKHAARITEYFGTEPYLLCFLAQGEEDELAFLERVKSERSS